MLKSYSDGNGEFTKGMDMLVNKNNLGFGYRSWRYVSIIIDNENIVQMFVESGKEDNELLMTLMVKHHENILSKL